MGEGGYQVGNFPVLLGRVERQHRDCIRGMKGDEHISEFAYRLTGSSDLYQRDGCGLTASINFVVAHDGFTLNDLVSYNDKHNDANGEGKATATVTIAAAPGIAASKAPPTTRRLNRLRRRHAISSPRFSFPKAWADALRRR